MKKIIRNISNCKICEDVIESKHTHDYVMYKCGAIFLDGGTEYQGTDGGQRKQRGKVEMK